MKKFLLSFSLFTILLLSFFAFRFQETKEGEMKQYFFVMYTKGANRTHDSTTAKKIMAGHMDNINQMHKDGKLCIAGPFGDDGDWRGILIIDTKTIEEAKTLVERDPAVIAGRLTYKIHPWWGGVGSKLK